MLQFFAGFRFMVSDGWLCPFDFLGKKCTLIPRHLIGATQHCTLGNCEWSIVLMDESVPEQHDLILSLGRGLEQKGRVLKTHLTELDV